MISENELRKEYSLYIRRFEQRGIEWSGRGIKRLEPLAGIAVEISVFVPKDEIVFRDGYRTVGRLRITKEAE